MNRPAPIALEAGGVRARLLPGTGSDKPLVLFLHGLGECGTDPDLVESKSLPQIASERPELWPGPILLPQKREPDAQWESLGGPLIELVAKAAEATGARRSVITGNSQGGHGALVIGARHPDRFDRVLGVCPYADPPKHGYGSDNWPFDPRSETVAEIASGLRSTPVRITHGLDDEVVPPDHARGLLAAIGGAGGDCLLELLPRTGHNAWSETYCRANIADWLLGRRTGVGPAGGSL